MRSGDPARPAGNHSVLTLVGRADGQRTGGRLPCGDSILVWYARTAGACTPMLAQTLFITCSSTLPEPSTFNSRQLVLSCIKATFSKQLFRLNYFSSSTIRSRAILMIANFLKSNLTEVDAILAVHRPTRSWSRRAGPSGSGPQRRGRTGTPAALRGTFSTCECKVSKILQQH